MSEPETIALDELAEVNPKVDLRRLRDDTLVSFIPMSDVTENGQWVNRQERRLCDVRVGYSLPRHDEQLAIEGRLNAIDKGLTAEESEQAKLHHLKSGLMTDLLTGRVRVPEGVAYGG